MIEPLEMHDAYGLRFTVRPYTPQHPVAAKSGEPGVFLTTFSDEGMESVALPREKARRLRDWLTEYLREEGEGS